MKVNEIISEGGFISGIGDVAVGASKLASKIKNYSVIKSLMYGSDREFIEKAADELASLAKSNTTLTNSKTPVQAALDIKRAQLQNQIDTGIYQAKKLAKNSQKSDEDLAKEIMQREGIDSRFFDAKLEDKLVSNAKQRLIMKHFGAEGDIIDWATKGGIVKKALQGWGFYELYQPYKDYADNMEIADQYLKAGPPKGFTQEQYNAYQNKQMSLMLGRMGALLLVDAVTRSDILVRKLKEWKLIAPAVDTVTLIANGRLKHWINTPGVTESIATLMMSDIVAGNTDIGLPGIGRLGVAARDSLRSVIGLSPRGQQSDAGAQPSTATPGSQQSINNTSSAPQNTTQANTGSSSSVGTSTGPDLSKYVQRSDNPNLIWDPSRPLSIMLKPPGWQPSN